MSDVVWTETFRVRAGETDPTARASVPALCSYLQEAASNQAYALQFSVEQLPGLTWVLVRLHLQVARYPVWRDALQVETWPAGVQGRYALREYLLRLPDGQVGARATSGWALIDLAVRRPVRFPDAITALPSANRPRALPDPFERLPSPPTAGPAARHRVSPSDIDMNRHVNNIRYITWALDALPDGWAEGRRLTSLEVHFRAETTAGATLGVEAAVDVAAGTCLHRVFHLDDGRDAALLRTCWLSEGG